MKLVTGDWRQAVQACSVPVDVNGKHLLKLTDYLLAPQIANATLALKA